MLHISLLYILRNSIDLSTLSPVVVASRSYLIIVEPQFRPVRDKARVILLLLPAWKVNTPALVCSRDRVVIRLAWASLLDIATIYTANAKGGHVTGFSRLTYRLPSHMT